MYQSTDRGIWHGREDLNEGDGGLRWHQKIKLVDLETEPLPDLASHEKGVVIVGFKSDEGVRRNAGRVGAKAGPDELRKACCNLADHFHTDMVLLDGGNVICMDQDLESAQIELEKLISKIRTMRYLPFVFGGGHEVAYPHFLGLFDSTPREEKIGIINIDAHFDLRKPKRKSTSGTPFFEISKKCQDNSIAFNYFCVGIQEPANTRALFERATALNTKYIFASEIKTATNGALLDRIKEFMNTVDHIYLTICMDAFDQSYAPGVSAPCALGLDPRVIIDLINEVVDSGKLISADVAELNPSFDEDGKTAKLAGRLAFEIVMNYAAT